MLTKYKFIKKAIGMAKHREKDEELVYNGVVLITNKLQDACVKQDEFKCAYGTMQVNCGGLMAIRGDKMIEEFNKLHINYSKGGIGLYNYYIWTKPLKSSKFDVWYKAV